MDSIDFFVFFPESFGVYLLKTACVVLWFVWFIYTGPLCCL